ncbi:hypothetical protein QQY79_19390 [Flavobacterium tructae]|uniref:hypothetical protein n=1 Tax=Flavobacterium tructae TaxID=1114873 RepID=UPI002551E233|nr:hypothetical protein [Flavobacterium tructae]MDL2144699.1 hypothetical protein [Flavobacterium tructae]
MMKLKTAKFLNFIILSIVLLGCERDLSNEDKEVKVTAPFKSNSLNLKGLPADIRNYITPDTNNNTARSGESGNDLQDAIFATQDIVKTTDSENVTNYSISFIYEDSPENVFYNLVINVLPTGEQSQYILKYTCNPADFPNFKSHNFDFNYFRGSTEMGVVTQNTGSFTGKSNSGDDPCPKIFIPPSGSGSNTGAVGGTVGGGGGTPSTSSGFNTTVAGYNVSASSSGGIYSVSVGTTTYYSGGGTTIIGGVTPGTNGASGANYFYYFRPLVKAPGTSKKASDCPDQTPPAGYVPVSTASEAIAVIKTKIKISKAQMVYLMNTPEALNLVYSLVYNNPSEEDKNFALAMIDALKDEGVVDLKYRVILDPTFSSNPCLMGVYTQLGGSATFQNYLKKFDGDFSVANLTLLASNTLSSNINAETTSPVNYMINITFNENNLRRPALSIARTFIHEMIHAEIYRKLLSVAGQPQIQFNQTQLVQLKDNYPGLYDYYMRFEFNIPIGQVVSDAQHEAMAMHYRGIIEQSLRQLDNTLSNEVYEALSWEGLKGTKAWDKLSVNKQNAITTIITNFNQINTTCQ